MITGLRLYHSSMYIIISSALYTSILFVPLAGAVSKWINWSTISKSVVSTPPILTLIMLWLLGTKVKSNVFSGTPSPSTPPLRVFNSLDAEFKVILGRAPVLLTVNAVVSTLLSLTFIWLSSI